MSLTEEYLKAYDQASQGLTRTGRAILRCSKNETDLGYIETSASDTVELKAGALDDDSLSKWFEEGQHKSSIPKLRLLYGSATVDEYKWPYLPFTAKAGAILSDHLNFDIQKFKVFNGESKFKITTFWKDRRQPADVCSAYCISSTVRMTVGAPDIVLLTHDRPSTNITHGLLVFYSEKGISLLINDLIARLSYSFQALKGHPISCALALCEQALAEHDHTRLGVASNIDGIGNRFGYFDRVEVEEKAWPSERSNIDLIEETNNIQRMTAGSANLHRCLSTQKTLLNRLGQQIGRGPPVNGNDPEGTYYNCQSMQADLEASNEKVIAGAEESEKVIQSFAQSLYNFMAIKEGRVNIELAQSSKEIAEATMHDSAAMKTIAELTRKDSSAMKSIAVLTMIFLPATTVASVLDTPFFDWDSNSSRLVIQGFWIFWTISIPLTVAVLMIWLLGVKLEWTNWLISLFRDPRPFYETRRKEKATEMNGAMFEMVDRMV